MINLDQNATTRPLPEVVETVSRVMRDVCGNPGSRHALGRQARRVLEESRETIAAVLGARPAEVVFTSGGTEATNMALCGLTRGRVGTILLPPGEHPATEQTVQFIVSQGWRRQTLALRRDGLLDSNALDEVPWGEVHLATILLAHNETGVIQETAALADACRERGIPLHVDGVQAVGKVAVDFATLGAATLAVAAHKFHGPRGIGALVIREGVRLTPHEYGGHQEQGRRPGTECVALAAGMAVALHAWSVAREERTAHVRRLRDRLQARLIEECAPVVINGSLERRLPNTLNIAFPGCAGESLLIALDLAGVACSQGSACASGSSEPAAILVAMGCPPDVLQSALRLSLACDNTLDEVDLAAARIAAVVHHQRAAAVVHPK